MPNDPYYKSPAWLALRADVLRRDRHTCTTPGCGRKGNIVDHIRPRSQGGPDLPSNCRTLCRECDNQAKERNGRRGAPKPKRTIGADGWPI